MSRHDCYVKDVDLVTREIAGETIIVPIWSKVADLDSIYTLNEVGSMIWNLIDGKTSVDQIVEAVCGAYDVSPEEARKDVLHFLESKKRQGLIKERPCEP